MKEKLVSNRFIVYAAVVISMIFWSLSFIWYKDIYEFLKPITTIFFRLVISSILLLIISLSIKKLQLIRKADLKMILLLAFFEPFLYFIGESFGMNYVSSTTGAVIISTIPLIMPFGAFYFLSERLTYLNIAGLLISFIGVLFVVLDFDFTFSASPLGIGLLFIAVVSAVIYSILFIKIAGKYNVITIITWQNSIGVFLFMPLFFTLEFEHFMTVDITSDVLTPLFELAVFASTFAFLFFTYGLKKLGVSRASVFTNLIPALTAVFAFVLHDETLGFKIITGIVLVISGLFLSQWRKRNKHAI